MLMLVGVERAKLSLLLLILSSYLVYHFSYYISPRDYYLLYLYLPKTLYLLTYQHLLLLRLNGMDVG